MKKEMFFVFFSLYIFSCISATEGASKERTVYDLIPRSIKYSNGNFKQDFIESFIAVYVNTTGVNKSGNKKITKAKALLAKMPPDEFERRFEDWLLIRNWYKKSIVANRKKKTDSSPVATASQTSRAFLQVVE